MQDGALARQAPASDKGRLTPLGLVSGRRAAISVQIDWRLWEQVVAGEGVPLQAFASLTTLSAATAEGLAAWARRLGVNAAMPA